MGPGLWVGRAECGQQRETRRKEPQVRPKLQRPGGGAAASIRHQPCVCHPERLWTWRVPDARLFLQPLVLGLTKFLDSCTSKPCRTLSRVPAPVPVPESGVLAVAHVRPLLMCVRLHAQRGSPARLGALVLSSQDSCGNVVSRGDGLGNLLLPLGGCRPGGGSGAGFVGKAEGWVGDCWADSGWLYRFIRNGRSWRGYLQLVWVFRYLLKSGLQL